MVTTSVSTLCKNALTKTKSKSREASSKCHRSTASHPYAHSWYHYSKTILHELEPYSCLNPGSISLALNLQPHLPIPPLLFRPIKHKIHSSQFGEPFLLLRLFVPAAVHLESDPWEEVPFWLERNDRRVRV